MLQLALTNSKGNERIKNSDSFIKAVEYRIERVYFPVKLFSTSYKKTQELSFESS
ncbi:hypothetical protein HMPREF1869_01596 [Bacteroidales bacterium KA00251]|nr:hypothetical protein HMPREF1869_01596 [Bacteroidales bacterium KA00251]